MKIELWMSWVGGFLVAISVLLVIFFVACWIATKNKMFDLLLEQNIGTWTITSLALAIFAGFIVGTVLHEVYDKTNPISVEETIIYEPVSMSDVIVSEGKGFGSYICIDAEQFYTFYYKYGDGYRTGKISAKNAIVYQTDDVKPSIVKKITKKACGELISSDYEIYIPKGSIIEKFNLDSN